jgi:hypothetical protein
MGSCAKVDIFSRTILFITMHRPPLSDKQQVKQYRYTIGGVIVSTVLAIVAVYLSFKTYTTDTTIKNMDSLIHIQVKSDSALHAAVIELKKGSIITGRILDSFNTEIKNQQTQIVHLIKTENLLNIEIGVNRNVAGTAIKQLAVLNTSVLNEDKIAVAKILGMCSRLSILYDEFGNDTAANITAENYKQILPVQIQFVESVIKILQENESNKFILSRKDLGFFWIEYLSKRDITLLALRVSTPEDAYPVTRTKPITPLLLKQKQDQLKDFLEWVKTIQIRVGFAATDERDRLYSNSKQKEKK